MSNDGSDTQVLMEQTVARMSAMEARKRDALIQAFAVLSECMVDDASAVIIAQQGPLMSFVLLNTTPKSGAAILSSASEVFDESFGAVGVSKEMLN